MEIDAEKATVEPTPGQTTMEVTADPSKQSFIKKIKTAKEENTAGNIALCFTMCGICLGTLGCQIIAVLFTLLPFAMVYFGAKNLHNCTISPFIPIYLLVQGICTLLDQLLIYCQCRNRDTESETNKKTKLGRLFDLFVMVWFCVGSVYVYKIYEPNYDNSAELYCDKTTYLFAFWSITIVYIFGAILVFACCCVCLVMCFLQFQDD